MSRTLRVLNVEDSEQEVALRARHLRRVVMISPSDRLETANTGEITNFGD